MRAVKELVDAEDSMIAEVSNSDIPEEMIDKVEKDIRKLMSERHLYLDPNLTRAAFATELGINERYLFITLKNRFGSFYSYVNRLRMECAIKYQQNHPDAKNEEVAENSGFGSVRTYYRVKNLYESGDL